MLVGLGIFIANMSGIIPPLSTTAGYYANCVLAIITFCVLAYCGKHFFIGAWRAFLAYTTTKDTLVALSLTIAWVYSCYVLIYINSISSTIIHLYFMHIAIIIALLNLIIIIEMRTREKIAYNTNELYQVRPEILQFINDAVNSKSFIDKFIDKIIAIFIPCILIITALTTVIWLNADIQHKTIYILTTIISLLVAASPYALSLSIHVSILFGMNVSAENGILIRKADVLQKISKITTLVIEKSNIICTGKTKLVSICNMPGVEISTILSLAASVEVSSQHRISKAIVVAATEQKIDIIPNSDLNIIDGLGISANVGGHHIALGSAAFMQAQLVPTNELLYQAQRCASNGQTAVFLAKDRKLSGMLIIDDPIKHGIEKITKELQKMEIKVIMITGDTNAAAVNIADKVGIENVISGVMPQEKVTQIKKLQEDGGVIAMIGDGINDATAIEQADVGFAISSNNNIDIASADVILINEPLNSIIDAINIARTVNENMHENILCATIYNIIAIPVAAGALFPIINSVLNPILAAVFATLCCIAIIFNASNITTYAKRS